MADNSLSSTQWHLLRQVVARRQPSLLRCLADQSVPDIPADDIGELIGVMGDELFEKGIASQTELTELNRPAKTGGSIALTTQQ